MTRSRASAKAAGARHCVICGTPVPNPGPSGGMPRKYCSPDCLNAARRAHYAQNPRPRTQWPSLAERLWARVDKSTEDGCWEWTGYRMPFGYGQIGLERGAGRTITTHRAAWMILVNGDPGDLHVLHHCDNPPCVNPAHLFLGTSADNMADKMRKGRAPRGFDAPNTRLSVEDVHEIRSAYRRFTVPGLRGYRSNRDELAATYGVSGKYIVAVAARQERADV